MFVSAKPAAKKKGGKKMTNVSIGVIVDRIAQSDATPIQIGWALNNSLTTAKPGKDFKGPTSGTFTFQPGEFQKNIMIQVNTAKLKQPEKAIVYQLGSVSGAEIGKNSTTAVDVINSSLVETQMKHLLLSQKKLTNTVESLYNEVSSEFDRGDVSSKLRRKFDSLLAITDGLRTAATGYAAIYSGDPAFDVAYQAFKDGSDTLILAEVSINILLNTIPPVREGS